MSPLNLTFDIPQEILAGIQDGSLIRRGGVIQDLSGRVVMWLREYNPGLDPVPFVSPGAHGQIAGSLIQNLNPATGVLNLAMSGVNAGISLRGFSAVTRQLNEIQGMLNIATAASILNLGVSAIGFAVIAKRLKELEKRLEKVQEFLQKIDQKIDLGFYANFRAALDLANNAFTMSKGDNRRSSALNAINRFLEAEHIYTDYADREFKRNSQIGDEYLLTLCLAYIAEARCYLELEEVDTAIRRYEEGKKQIRLRIEKYVDTLLTSKPLMYLHPDLKEKTDLARLTRIYQWKAPELRENGVFELIRDDIVPSDNFWSGHIDTWIKSLPASVVEPLEVKKDWWGVKKEGRTEIIKKLPQAMEEMESMIETNQRFEAYELEVKAVAKLGMSFHEWLHLKPAEPQLEGQNIVYMIPKEPLTL